MDIVILLFDRFEPLDAIGPYEILAHVPGAKVRFVAPGGGGVWSLLADQDVLGWVRRVHATTRFTTSVCASHPALHRVRPAAPVRQRLDGRGTA